MTRLSEADGIVTFHLESTYDALRSDGLQSFEADVLQKIAESPSPKLIFDFSDTTYISSSFVEALMRGWKKLQEKDGSMALCCLNNNCATVLKVCRLDRIWKLCANHAEAEAAVK